MFYDAEGYAASVKDERYARRLVMDADSEARRFVNLNKEAQEKNDQGLYEQLNDSRRTVAAEHARLIAEHSELPLASHGLVLESAERLRRLLEEFPDVSDPQADNVTDEETYARTHDGVVQSVKAQHDMRVDDRSFTTSSERNNQALAHPFVSSQEDINESIQTPPRPPERDALPMLGRDGKPIPSVVGGGESQPEDEDEDLAQNHRSISDILAEASPNSVVENTAGARGGVASDAAAPRENVAPITAAPNGNIAPIAVTSKDIVSSPTVKRKRNRKKLPQALTAASLGAVGRAHAVWTSGSTCLPPPPLTGVGVDPSKSLSEKQRVAIRAKHDRFMN